MSSAGYEFVLKQPWKSDDSGATVLHDLPALEYEVIDNVDGLPPPEEFLNVLPNILNAGPENLEGN